MNEITECENEGAFRHFLKSGHPERRCPILINPNLNSKNDIIKVTDAGKDKKVS